MNRYFTTKDISRLVVLELDPDAEGKKQVPYESIKSYKFLTT